MLESIKRLFAHWHRIPRKKVPRLVRGKLYGQNYVKDRGREYKKLVIQKRKSYYVSDGADHDGIGWNGELWVKRHKFWKKHKFYYRNIKVLSK